MFKKYIWRNGKKYGPYLYQNKRVGNKIITSYVGQGKESFFTLHKFLLIFILFVFIIGFVAFELFNPNIFSANVVSEDSSVSEIASTSEINQEQINIPETASQETLNPSSEGSNEIPVSDNNPAVEIPQNLTEEIIIPLENEENLTNNETEEIIIDNNLTNNETFVNETELIFNETFLNITNVTNIGENINLNLTNITIKTTNSRIRLGEKVKWTKNVSLDSPVDVSIKIPNVAENVVVKTIDEINNEEIIATIQNPISGSVILENNLNEFSLINWVRKLFGAITGRVIEETNVPVEILESSNEDTVELALEANATEYSVEYYTPAPEAFEKETNYGKEVVISGPDNLNYTNILAYSNLPKEVLNNNSIKLYWIVNNSRELVNFEAFDEDGNGLFDYIEWDVPHLSNQTYEISIVILNPITYLRDNETWVVAFNTTGEADLTISSTNAGWEEILSDNSGTFDEMRFLDLKCGEESLKDNLKIIDNNDNEYSYSGLSESSSINPEKFVIFNYSCENNTGYFSNYMNKAGYAILNFTFGNESALAVDPVYLTGVYNFTDTTNNKAYYCTSGTDEPYTPSSFSSCPGYAEYSGEYTNVADNDGNRNTYSGGSGSWVNLLYNFTIYESVGDISEINLTWIGYDTLGEGDEFDLWIWNYTSSSWIMWAQYATGQSSDQIYTINYTSGFSDLISGNNLHVGVSGAYYSSGGGVMYENYVDVKVTYNSFTISSCADTITQAGTYNLTGNLDCTGTNGINIANDNVTIDCQGYYIDGDNSADTYGVNAIDKLNVTIQNCRITDFDKGIFFSSTNNSLVTNVTSQNNNWDFYSNTSSTDNNVIALNTSGGTIISFISLDVAIKGFSSGLAPVNPGNYYNISKYVNITNTSEAGSWINLNVSYLDSDLLAGVGESTLNIWMYNESSSSWQLSGFGDGAGVDVENNIVYKNITSFASIFAPFGYFNISSCGNTISSGGYYFVDANLTASSGACIAIGASDITINCQGNIIDGNDVYDGIYVNSAYTTTIRDCIINNSDDGVATDSGSLFDIANSTLSNNNNGLRAQNAISVNLHGNNISFNTNGLSLLTATGNVTNNSFEGNTNYGVLIYNPANILGNTFVDDGTSIYENSGGSTIYNNNIKNPSVAGINIANGGVVNLTNNVITSNTVYLTANYANNQLTNIIFNTSNGQINFPGTITMAASEISPADINISFNDASVDSAINIEFNTTANVTLNTLTQLNTILQPDATGGKDAWIMGETPDTNYGGETTIIVGDYYSSAYVRRGLIQFNLSALPEGAIITNATLELRDNGAGTLSNPPAVASLFRITEDWSETAITWNNQPIYSDEISSQNISSVGVWTSWDITNAIQNWHSGNWNNSGMMLVFNSVPNVNILWFYSSDYSDDSSLRPKLTISSRVPYGAILNNPIILKNGEPCGSECYNFSALTASNVIFNVSSWSNYSIGETPIYPTFSNYWDNNGTLYNSGIGLFNVTLSNTNGSVFLEINGENVTAENLTADVYNASYAFTTNGTYSYKWIAFGNGITNNLNISETRSYDVVYDGVLNVTLDSPVDLNAINIANVTFIANVSDDYGIKNVSLWTNISGEWLLNETYYSYNFNFTSIDEFTESELWNENSVTGSVSGGNYVAEITDVGDPFFYQDITDFDETYDYLIMRYKSYSGGPSAIGVYYADGTDCVGSYSETCVQHNIAINSDGGWHTLYAQMIDDEWIDNDGIITDLRLDFESASTTGTFYIDYIRFGANSNITFQQVNWTLSNLAVGNYLWNVQAFDSLGQEDWGDVNWTFSVIDDILPTFDNLANFSILDNESLSYDINATDNVLIGSFWINDTTSFTINSTSGLLENATALSVGMYWINVSVNDSSNNIASDIIYVEVNDSNLAPSQLTLLSPENGTTISDLTPNFVWNRAIDAENDTLTYDISVDNDSDFSSPEINDSGIAERVYIGDMSYSSAGYSGTTLLDKNFEIPIDGNISYVKLWVTSGINCKVKGFRDDGTTIIYLGESETLSLNAYTNEFNLTNQISVKKGDYVGLYCPGGGGAIGIQTPVTYNLWYYVGDATTNLSRSYYWSEVSQQRMSMEVEIKGGEIIGYLNQTTQTISYINNSALADSTTYFWKVRAFDGSLYGDWSEVWNFTESLESGISILMSENLTSGIYWNLESLPAVNQSAGGNNGELETTFFVNVSAIGGNVDLYIKANGDLTDEGGDIIGIGNETYSYNLTDGLVPSEQKFSITTNYVDNKIGDNLVDGSSVYLKFFLNAPSGQPAGTYNNSVSIKAVPYGASP